MEFKWNDKVFLDSAEHFDKVAIEVFRYQAAGNPLYSAFLKALEVDFSAIVDVTDIPYLPVRFFKTHEVKTGEFEPQALFESSGTTGSVNSRHFVKDRVLYEVSFKKSFEHFYGPANRYCIIGLLPSYLERQHSSLVYMVDKLIQQSGHPQSGFYLNEFEKLAVVLQELNKQGQPVILIGVTFALLDFAEKFSFPLKHTIIVETGGMKGRREELIRSEVHDQLKKSFQLSMIHSEYGMTELLSQAYSEGEGIFNCPPWMKMLVRDDEDPFLVLRKGAGTLNVIDLANVHSCSLLATDDVGRIHSNESFEVLGRVDGSDLRGCSLMTI